MVDADKTYRVSHGREDIAKSLWQNLGFSLFYVITGLIGFISAVVKQKRVYFTHMVFSIVNIVVMFPFALIGLLAIGEFVTEDTSQCVSLGTECQCPNSEPAQMTWDDWRSRNARIIVMALFIVVAWVLSFVGSILSCNLSR